MTNQDFPFKQQSSLPSDQNGEGDFDFSTLPSILWRRKKSFLGTVAFVSLTSTLFFLTETSTFEAEARILIEDGAAAGGILGELSGLAGAPPATAELEVVQSREIANRIVAPPENDSLGLSLTIQVDDLDLYSPWGSVKQKINGEIPGGSLAAELAQPAPRHDDRAVVVSFNSAASGTIRKDSVFSQKKTPFAISKQSPIEFQGVFFYLYPEGDLTGRQFRIRWTTAKQAAENLLENLSVVETARGSGVLRITFQDTDPHRAAQVTNSLVSGYLDRCRERMSRRAETTVLYIDNQIDRIQKELEAAEAELVVFQEKEGAAFLSETAQAAVERMSELDLEQAKLAMLIEGQNQLIESLEKGTSAEAAGASAELHPQTATMLEELTKLASQAAFLAESHTEEWPPLRQLRAQIGQLRAKVSGSARAHAKSLRKRSESLESALKRWQGQLSKLPATERELAKFQRKASSFERIYTYLLAEGQKALIAANAAVPAVAVVDWGIPPIIRASPRLTLNTFIALLIGIFLGAAVAIWRESTQKTILSAAQLREVTNLPQWGSIPNFHYGDTSIKAAKGKEIFLALREDPGSIAAESYRALRANLRFAAKDQKIKTLTITSAAQGEGKSTTIADLAIALAKGGATVLLVDADLRRPIIHRMFPCPQSPGLAEFIQKGIPWEDCLNQDTDISGLHTLPAGEVENDNPGDLLAQQKVIALVDTLKKSYDYVLFDVPPVLAVADASSFLGHLDAILLLARYDHMPESAIASANNHLALAGAQAIGAILNGAQHAKANAFAEYGSQYGYR